MRSVGILAFHGDVIEHARATAAASKKLGAAFSVTEVRSAADLENLAGLIIPGGESTNFYKRCMREGMMEPMKKAKAIFGTCAGAIMLAKKIHGAEDGQRTLGVMDIEIDRNAYGRQAESFEERIVTGIGK